MPLLARAALAATETDATLEVEVSLRMRDFPGLQSRVHRGEKISPMEMAARYRPGAANYQAVSNWLVSEGLTITRTDPGQLVVFARGTVRQMAAAFQVRFARVAAQGVEYTSAVTPPSLPAALASAVLSINGLQPHIRPHKLLLPGTKPQSTTSTTAPAYWPRDILRAYGGAGLTQTGAGQTIAIVIDSFPIDSDLTTFWSTVGVGQSLANIVQVPVSGGPSAASQTADLNEASLDVEWSSSIAPAATIRVYGVPGLDTISLDAAYAQIYSDVSTGAQPNLHQVSISVGIGETQVPPGQLQTDEQFFAEMSAVGVTVFAASGDNGSEPYGTLQVEAPASSPSVTAVGGTSLVLDATTGAVTSEAVWYNPFFSEGTGGGVSVVFPRPVWQVGTGVPAGTQRLVPDVAAPADPGEGALDFYNGTSNTVGGTSWASPTWAGFCALINQARADAGFGSLGLLGPNLYPLLLTPSFRDITTGDIQDYNAGVGFDLCTGLGVPNLPALLNALTNPPLITGSSPTRSVSPGANAVFSVVASGAPPLTLQWQRLPAGGNTWVNLSDHAPYSGTATTTLTVAAVNSGMSGDRFRCMVSNSFGSVTSTPVGLIVALPCLIQTIAGIANTAGAVDGPGASATFNFPNGIGADSSGNLYVGDMYNNLVRKITPAGIVSSIAGNPTTQFNGPAGVAWDATTGNVYVLDSGHNNIRAITPAGVVSLLAGSSSGTSGYTDSPTGTDALFFFPADLSIDAAGNLYVVDQGNSVIRMITPAGAVTTLAGSGKVGSTDGTGTAASFNQPGGIGIDPAGNLYIADNSNETIRKIAMPGAVVTTIAGSPGAVGSTDGVTGAEARFNSPGDVQPDAFGNIYVIDSGNDTLREILSSGAVITVAGVAGKTGAADGVGPAALFEGPGSIILEPGGTFAIADTFGNTIRRATQLVAPSVQIGPGAPTVLSPNSIVFTALVSGTPAPAIQWQRLPAGGANWINLTNNATYGGSTTTTLTVLATTPAMDGDQFRCVITNAAGTATSQPAALTVQFPPQFTSAGTAAFVTGQPGAFTFTATGSPTASFNATGLPAWAAFDPSSGVLSGTPPDTVGSPFTITVSASNGIAPPASQSFTLVVVPGQTFANWQTVNFTSNQIADPTISGPTVVLGPDNATNLLKYALGVAAFSAVPAGGQTATTGPTGFKFTYARPAANTDLTYTVQESTDLKNWTSVGVTQQVIATDATGMQTWQGLFTSTAPAVFFRLLVTQP